MITQLLDLSRQGINGPAFDTSFSLAPFIAFLKSRLASSKGRQHAYLASVLDVVQEHPLRNEELDLDKIEDYADLLETIYTTLSLPLANEQESYWAMALPFTPKILAGTEAFYNFIATGDGLIRENLINAHKTKDKDVEKLFSLYCFVLERLYGIVSDKAMGDMIHLVKDEETGLNRYFLIDFDSRFVEITFDGVLPKIDFRNLHIAGNNKQELIDDLLQALPLEKIKFTGFSLLNVKEITAHYVVEKIKNIIVNLSPGQYVYDDISDLIKELLGNSHLDVQLMPALKVNDKLIVNCVEEVNDKLEATCRRYKLPKERYIETIKDYSNNPQVIFRGDLSEEIPDEDGMFALLRAIGVEGLIVLPIFFQRQLVGILTIYSKEKNALQEHMFALLDPIVPLLEQLLQTSVDDFKIVLDNTVKEKFTFLQPSVEWRFNEVAFNYLQQKEKDSKVEISEVHFDNVYPLYGAVDIRNSTQERNSALRADMIHHLQLTLDILDVLAKGNELSLTNEIIFKTNRWYHKIQDFISSEDEFQLNLFLEDELLPYLQYFRQRYPSKSQAIDEYMHATGTEGSVFKNRRELEESFKLLNRTVGNLLEQMNIEIQNVYPCYFEKYRSDGIEYDIYIGQSITPNLPFHQLYLKNLRLWQLNSMAIVVKLTHSLQQQMPKKLQTTQLIFLHANAIDISFRNDEHRFDVEGAYNIRYEMIKKRIDKVLIRNTSERLTQPGKVAIVYFQPKDIEEYISHIHYLQSQGILADEIEYLELEELQGVSGLKALRVGVIIDDHIKEEEVSKQLLQTVF